MIFRADASADIGGGHIMRCLTLAGQLAAYGWDCFFETSEVSLATVPLLGHASYEVVTGQDSWGAQCDLLIVDHYGLDQTYESSQRGRAKCILVIDDVPERAHDCDILIDQSPGRKVKAYAALTPPTCRCLTGVNFSLIRPEFLHERKKANVRKELRSVLVSTGATDPAGATEIIMQALAESSISAKVTVVLTGAMASHQAWQAIAQSHGYEVVTEPENMALLMRSHDFAIGAAGGMSWERCCVGLPSAVYTVADNQRHNAAMLDKLGAAISLGMPAARSSGTLAKILSTMTPETLARMSERAFALVDGLGVKRVMIALADTVRLRSEQTVSLRCAEPADMEQVFEWQCIPDIRRHFREPEPPVWSEHKIWFADAILDPAGLFCIVEVDACSCGFVRLSPRKQNGFEISILVSPEWQGKGVAGAALSMARKLCPGADLWAHVKPENVVSGRLFLVQGYESAGDDWYLNAGCHATESSACQ